MIFIKADNILIYKNTSSANLVYLFKNSDSAPANIYIETYLTVDNRHFDVAYDLKEPDQTWLSFDQLRDLILKARLSELGNPEIKYLESVILPAPLFNKLKTKYLYK